MERLYIIKIKILVHGGGKIASEIAKSLGIQPQMVNGRRITDQEMLEVVLMVYGGLINKRIVSQLQALGCNAIGLTGADANIIKAHKRQIKEIDFGFVGDITSVNTNSLKMLIDQRLIPVIAPLTHDLKGNMLNTNADTIASKIASALSEKYETNLFYCFDQPGLLLDINRSDSLLKEVNWTTYSKLKADQVVTRGMIPKMDTAFEALKAGTNRVKICHSKDLLYALNNEVPIGTELKLT